MEEQKLRILTLVKPASQKLWKEVEEEWQKYFKVEQIIDVPENIKKHSKKRIDILFTDEPDAVDNFYIGLFKNTSQAFAFVGIKDKPSASKDAEWFMKKLVDRIIYTGLSRDYTVWASMSSLRRYWGAYSKPSTIIYKDLIADFVESKFSVNGKEIKLTSKEVDLLRYLLNNRESFIPKKKVFKDVWGFEEMDTTRTVDQMIFKLKNKIGRDYFTIVRNKGVKFG